MNKNLIIFGIIILLICIGLSGCNFQSSEENRFVGTWKKESDQYSQTILTFYSDGTYSIGSTTMGDYNIKDGKLELQIIDSSMSQIYEYSFSNNDKTLTLSSVGGGLTEVFNKQ